MRRVRIEYTCLAAARIHDLRAATTDVRPRVGRFNYAGDGSPFGRISESLTGRPVVIRFARRAVIPFIGSQSPASSIAAGPFVSRERSSGRCAVARSTAPQELPSLQASRGRRLSLSAESYLRAFSALKGAGILLFCNSCLRSSSR